MIPNEFIDELLEKVDIVDIIDGYVPLKKGGLNYMACCPFHKEKSPSFTVSPTKQFYHCFGCGAHGSAISFLMEYQGASFVDAVGQLADRVGMTVPKQVAASPEQSAQAQARREQKRTLESTTEQAASHFQKQLKLSQTAIEYLKKRGLTGQIAAHYGLGYAPDDWQTLAQSFNPYPTEHLIESGLVISKESKHYDRFRDRIMFPIRNQRGAVVGFGGRIIGQGEPKYLNSPETPLFEKGKELYGLFEGRAAIKDAGRVLVVEGYMDVVALAQFEVGYAVASLGTATTADHIKLLMRQSDQIYFCFDGDNAGKKAAWRALENALPMLQDGKSLHFLFLPEEHDPDSYIREYGKEAFETQLVKHSLPLSHYFLQHLGSLVDLKTSEGKADFIKQATPLLNQIKAPTLGFLLKQKVAKLIDVTQDDLEQLLGQQPRKKSTVGFKSYRLPKTTFRQHQTTPLIHRLIKWLLMNPKWAQYVSIPEYLIAEDELACLMTLAEAAKSMNDQATSARLVEYMRQSDYEDFLNQILKQAIREHEEFEEPKQEDEESFILGIQKLLNELKYKQLEQLKKHAKERALTESEEQLLLALLMSH